MDEKVYGGQTMSKRKLLTVILLAFVTTLMLVCAVIFTACGNNETPDDGHNTEQGEENPDDGDEPGTNPGTNPDDDKDIAVTTVSLDKTSLTLEVGESYTLVVTVSPSNATDKSVTWSSANSSVASVSGGKVTAKSEGTTTITAEAHNGKKATCTVIVNEPAPEVIEVTSVSLNKTSLTLEIGESETLTATVLPSNATDKSVTWTSSDQSVVTVANGKITAIGSGTATITATTSNGKTVTCTVTVNAAVPEITQVEGATIDGTSIFMLVDHTTDSVALLNKVTVSSGSWNLYSDILGQNRIPTKIAAATVPSRTPASVCRNRKERITAMITSEQSTEIFALAKGAFTVLTRARATPSPAMVTTSAVTSKLTPTPTSRMPRMQNSHCCQ